MSDRTVSGGGWPSGRFPCHRSPAKSGTRATDSVGTFQGTSASDSKPPVPSRIQSRAKTVLVLLDASQEIHACVFGLPRLVVFGRAAVPDCVVEDEERVHSLVASVLLRPVPDLEVLPEERIVHDLRIPVALTLGDGGDLRTLHHLQDAEGPESLRPALRDVHQLVQRDEVLRERRIWQADDRVTEERHLALDAETQRRLDLLDRLALRHALEHGRLEALDAEGHLPASALKEKIVELRVVEVRPEAVWAPPREVLRNLVIRLELDDSLAEGLRVFRRDALLPADVELVIDDLELAEPVEFPHGRYFVHAVLAGPVTPCPAGDALDFAERAQVRTSAARPDRPDKVPAAPSVLDVLERVEVAVVGERQGGGGRPPGGGGGPGVSPPRDEKVHLGGLREETLLRGLGRVVEDPRKATEGRVVRLHPVRDMRAAPQDLRVGADAEVLGFPVEGPRNLLAARVCHRLDRDAEVRCLPRASDVPIQRGLALRVVDRANRLSKFLPGGVQHG